MSTALVPVPTAPLPIPPVEPAAVRLPPASPDVPPPPRKCDTIEATTCPPSEQRNKGNTVTVAVPAGPASAQRTHNRPPTDPIEGFDNGAWEFRGGFIPVGFQVRKIRRPRKNVPEWANSNRGMIRFILWPALRRMRIAYLYWRVGMNAREIAESMKMKRNNVKAVIRRLVRATKDTL